MSNYKWIKTSIPDFKIRFADEHDVSLILQFIQELAEYEKLSHEVVADEQMLRVNLFGKKAHAEVLLGYTGNLPAGFALFFHNFSTFLGKPGIYLEDLYVKPSMRGNGFGRVLLTQLAKIAVDRDCGRLEWSVLNWNKPAIKFYNRMGAKAMDEWTVYRVTGNALQTLADEFKNIED